jgi:RHS repeat-associated protein
MWESRRDFQEEWEGWKTGFMVFHAFHSSAFPMLAVYCEVDAECDQLRTTAFTATYVWLDNEPMKLSLRATVLCAAWVLQPIRLQGQKPPEIPSRTDPLGTKRVQTSASGVAELNCLSMPFGDGLNCIGTGTDATPHHFTGKERDTETGFTNGNDYFGSRYYVSLMGRFMSPDLPVDQHPADPQSWNLYSYVRNNPLSLTDATGDYAAERM